GTDLADANHKINVVNAANAADDNAQGYSGVDSTVTAGTAAFVELPLSVSSNTPQITVQNTLNIAANTIQGAVSVYQWTVATSEWDPITTSEGLHLPSSPSSLHGTSPTYFVLTAPDAGNLAAGIYKWDSAHSRWVLQGSNALPTGSTLPSS